MMLTKDEKARKKRLKKKIRFMKKLNKEVNKGRMTVNEYMKELEDWKRHN